MCALELFKTTAKALFVDEIYRYMFDYDLSCFLRFPKQNRRHREMAQNKKRKLPKNSQGRREAMERTAAKPRTYVERIFRTP